MQVKLERHQIIKYVKIGLFIGGGILLFKFIRKQIRLAKLKGKFGDYKTITDNNAGNTGGVSLPQDAQNQGFNPRPSAEALRDAMKGWGTDEDKIWNTLEPLSPNERTQVRTYFNTYFGDGDNLFGWFDGDLSGHDLTRAKGYFN